VQPGIIPQTPFYQTDIFPLPPQQDNELVEWEKIRVLEALFGVNMIIYFCRHWRDIFSRKNITTN